MNPCQKKESILQPANQYSTVPTKRARIQNNVIVVDKTGATPKKMNPCHMVTTKRARIQIAFPMLRSIVCAAELDVYTQMVSKLYPSCIFHRNIIPQFEGTEEKQGRALVTKGQSIECAESLLLLFKTR